MAVEDMLAEELQGAMADGMSRALAVMNDQDRRTKPNDHLRMVRGIVEDSRSSRSGGTTYGLG